MSLNRLKLPGSFRLTSSEKRGRRVLVLVVIIVSTLSLGYYYDKKLTPFPSSSRRHPFGPKMV